MTPDEREKLALLIRREIGYKGKLLNLAARSGLARDTLYTWFTGRASPEWDSLKLLAAGLGLSMTAIVGEVEGIERCECGAFEKQVRPRRGRPRND